MQRITAWKIVLWSSLGMGCALAQGQGYSVREAISRMTFPAGVRGTLFAAEPEVRQPIFCKCDDRGRLWTIQYLQYPNPAGLKRVQVDRFSRTIYDRKPEPPPRGPRGEDRITICEDTDGDGRADKFRDFVTGLNLCTGVEFGQGGVYVIQAPYLLFYPDRDRNDIPDSDPEVLLDGFGMEDAQSLANHLTWGPDGWLYGLNGSTTTCRIRGLEFQQGVWRYHPATRAFELFCEGGGNIYGLTFDRWGRLFYSSNGGLFYHGVQGAYYEKNFGKHGPLHNPYAYGYFSHVRSQGQTGRPNTGATIYLGTTFPAPFHHAFLCGDFLNHTCSWWTLQERGSTVEARLGGYLLESHDTWFGATDLCLGPDGAVYVCDFHDRRTAHPDPDAQWDRSNGRIYRLQAEGTASAPVRDVSQASTTDLVKMLTDGNGWLRDRARRLLAERQDPAAHDAVRELARQTEDAGSALQGLWAAHGCGVLDEELTLQVLGHPAEHSRAWAVRFSGDRREVEASVAQRLIGLARSESSVIVRAQLAASARRLPGSVAVPVLAELLRRDLDRDDPYVPWLLWWGVESQATGERERLLSALFPLAATGNELAVENLMRLVRRYAAEGTADGYRAAHTILTRLPADKTTAARESLWLGLTERSRADAAEVGDPLRAAVLGWWQAESADRTATMLALELGDAAPQVQLVQRVQASREPAALLSALEILATYGKADCVPAVLSLLQPDRPEAVQLAAIECLRRFVGAEVGKAMLRAYPQFSDRLRARARDLLFSRAEAALLLLEQVDRGQIAAKEIPLEQLQRLALLQDEQVDALVRKHWGQLRAATPEEKLADVRRFQNDLRAASGDAASGKALFRQHCGTCHRLGGEGNQVGPDLSATARGDQASLLANIVDPSVVVRKEYTNYVVQTTGGSVLTGLVIEQDGAGLTLVDGKNQRTRLRKEEIAELSESPVSLMPEKLLDPLTPQQLRDLFAFLQQAGG